jgi:hypothetical protein
MIPFIPLPNGIAAAGFAPAQWRIIKIEGCNGRRDRQPSRLLNCNGGSLLSIC